MAKKRSCRRTADEGRIHEKAVKWRRMTDEQLVSYVEDRVAKAKSEGFNKGIQREGQEQRKARELRAAGIAGFLECLEENRVNGIGPATISRLKGAAEKYGYIS